MKGPAGAIVVGSAVTGDLALTADACVIGSGAGGAVAARELTRAGLRVVMLEEGPAVGARDLGRDEGDARLRLYRGGGWRASVDGGVQVLEGRCVGGSTTVNLGTALRAPDDVLAAWAAKTDVPDLGPAGMAPLYEEIEREIDVVRVPEEMINANNRALLRGASALGWSAETLPRAMKGCVGCGSCAQGCPTGGKRSMLVTYIPDAIRAGLRLHADARARILLLERGRVAGVQGSVRGASGSRRAITVRAPIVIVAAGAIETPCLLQRSRVPDPGGRIGRGLRLNPATRVIGTFHAPIRGYAGIPQSARSTQFAGQAGEGGYTLEGNFAGPATFASEIAGFGRSHKKILARYRRMAAIDVHLQERATGEVRAEGAAGAEILHAPNDADRTKLDEGIQNAAVLLFEAGASKVIAGPRLNAILDSRTDLGMLDRHEMRRLSPRLFATRPQGTCPLGARAESSVTGPLGEVHGIKGLFVADASLFPGPLGGPPQLTVMALALRTARALTSA